MYNGRQEDHRNKVSRMDVKQARKVSNGESKQTETYFRDNTREGHGRVLIGTRYRARIEDSWKETK